MNRIKIIDEGTFKQMRKTSQQFKMEIKRPKTANAIFHGDHRCKTEQEKFRKIIKLGIIPRPLSKMKSTNFKTQNLENGISRNQSLSNLNHTDSRIRKFLKEQRQQNNSFTTTYNDIEAKNKKKYLHMVPKLRTKTETVTEPSKDEKQIRMQIHGILEDFQGNHNLFHQRMSKKLEQVNMVKFGSFWAKHNLQEKLRRPGRRLKSNQIANTRRANCKSDGQYLKL